MSGITNNSFNRKFRKNSKTINKTEYSQLSFKDNSFKVQKDEPMKVETSKFSNFSIETINQPNQNIEDNNFKYFNKFNSPSSKMNSKIIIF